MRKLHFVSLALVAAPLVLLHACGGDDTAAPGGSAGSGTAGSGGSATAGSAGSGTAGTAGSSTGGGGAGGGTAGTAGSSPDGSAGTGGSADGGDAAKLDVAVADVVIGDSLLGSDASNTCTSDAASAGGKSCNDYCDSFMANCNGDPVFADAGGPPYANAGACRSQCNGYSQAQLCCYITHVNNASGYDAGTGLRSAHCTHAAGAAGQTVCPARQ
jgi:hypothetical protein